MVFSFAGNRAGDLLRSHTRDLATVIEVRDEDTDLSVSRLLWHNFLSFREFGQGRTDADFFFSGRAER